MEKKYKTNAIFGLFVREYDEAYQERDIKRTHERKIA
jgi:hypothetical protein